LFGVQKLDGVGYPTVRKVWECV